MADSRPTDPFPLLPGRECGPCTACCVHLTIDEPTLRKPRGVPCPNLQADGLCCIYDDRPNTCRSFFCGWRRLRFVRESLRPDRSDVLIRLQYAAAADGGPMQLGINVGLLSEAALEADGLAEAVAAAVSAGLPVFLHIPGPSGHTAAQARVDAVLVEPVRARDRAAVLETLRRLRAEALAGPFRPVAMARRTDASRD
jgi:hypothetical protein